MDFEREGIAGVEGDLLNTCDPGAADGAQCGGGGETGPECSDRRGVEASQVARLRGHREALEGDHESLDVGNGVRGGIEWTAGALFVLEVALDAHRAEEEPAEVEGRRGGLQRVLKGAGARGTADGGRGAAPAQRGRASGGVTGGEADAGVVGIGEQVHDAGAAFVDVGLEGVAGGVAVEAGLVAAVGAGVVEAGVGEAEDGWDGGEALGLCRGEGRQEGQRREEGGDAGAHASAVVAGIDWRARARRGGGGPGGGGRGIALIPARA